MFVKFVKMVLYITRTQNILSSKNSKKKKNYMVRLKDTKLHIVSFPNNAKKLVHVVLVYVEKRLNIQLKFILTYSKGWQKTSSVTIIIRTSIYHIVLPIRTI